MCNRRLSRLGCCGPRGDPPGGCIHLVPEVGEATAHDPIILETVSVYAAHGSIAMSSALCIGSPYRRLLAGLLRKPHGQGFPSCSFRPTAKRLGTPRLCSERCRIRGLAAWFPYWLDAAVTPPALGLGPAAERGAQEQKNRP